MGLPFWDSPLQHPQIKSQCRIYGDDLLTLRQVFCMDGSHRRKPAAGYRICFAVLATTPSQMLQEEIPDCIIASHPIVELKHIVSLVLKHEILDVLALGPKLFHQVA